MQGLLQKAEEFSKLGGLAATGEGVERLIPSNWAHTVHYTAQRYHAPESVEEVCEIVAHASRVRVIGTRHACSTCADCPDGDLADVVKRSEEQHDRSLTLADAMAADMNALAKEQKAKESAETMESIHKARTAAGDKTT